MTGKEAIQLMYEAAVCAVCHCDNNVTGVFPCDCGPDEIEKRQQAYKMLREVRQELIDKLDDNN